MFKKGTSGNPNGRPKGSKNKRSLIDESTKEEAKRKLSDAVKNGEQWAVMAVIDRLEPKLKPVTPDGSIDAAYIEARIFELTELEKRLEALENESKSNH